MDLKKCTILLILSVWVNLTTDVWTGGIWAKKISTSRQLVIWNVGQGQWVTRISEDSCEHFDLGGEYFPDSVFEECSSKKNYVSLTHWDQDHTNFALNVLRKFPQTCLLHLPLGHHKLRRQLAAYPLCRATPEKSTLLILQPQSLQNQSNSNSSSFIVDQKVLITGDLPRTSEQFIFRKSNLSQIQFYIVGHHGSQTSTSDFLLRKMNHLRLAIVSARKAKYGHPHVETLVRLQKTKTPVLTTENWGHIRIQY